VSKLRHLSWENFRATVLIAGQQRVHRIFATPPIEVFGDGLWNRVGGWFGMATASPVPAEIQKLAFIQASIVTRHDQVFLELSTANSSLHRQLYHFVAAVAERIATEKRSVYEAVLLELDCFSELLEQQPLLGIERQIGLLGELLFLERLSLQLSTAAVEAWLGPIREPHDFRVRDHEYEVKTTVSPQRIHTIHGSEQLIASKGCVLYLTSVLIGPPGAQDGFSLAGKVADLHRQFEPSPTASKHFAEALEASGYRSNDARHYSRRFVLRRNIGIARVDGNFPAITRTTIQNALGPLASRIEHIAYEVNIEGLEYEDGSNEFQAAISPQ
jgi:hypothetical protein